MFPEPDIFPTNWTCPNCVEDASESDGNAKRSLENSASPEPLTRTKSDTIQGIMSRASEERPDPAESDVAPSKRNPSIQPTVDNQLKKNSGHIDTDQLPVPNENSDSSTFKDFVSKFSLGHTGSASVDADQDSQLNKDTRGIGADEVPVPDEEPGPSTFKDFISRFSLDHTDSASADTGQVQQSDLARAIEAPTDSGYGSQLATGVQKSFIQHHAVDAQYEPDVGFDDTATEYSDTSSVATWKKESYIEEFVDDLVAGVRELQPDEETLNRISALLPDLLKAFALRVGYNAPSRMHRDVMYFIHKYRGMISSNFKEKSLHRGEESSDATLLPGEGDRIPLQDLIKTWFSSQSNVEIGPENESWDPMPRCDDSDSESQASTHTDTCHDMTKGDNDVWLRSYRDFIRSSEVFQWLLGRLYVESSLVKTEPRAMEAIRTKIISSLSPSRRISRNVSSECFNASFCVGWDLFGFFQGQEYELDAAEVISGIITLTGSENDAQALTCSQYLSQTWPTTGCLTLRVIKDILLSGPNHLQKCTYPDGTTLDARLHDSTFTAQVTGVADSIAEIGEQIAWISASLRTSHLSSGLLYCTPIISRVCVNLLDLQTQQSKSRLNVTFDINIRSVEVSRLMKLDDGQCWHNMFLNPVVVKGYPVRRKAEKNSGVEMTLDIMAGLARTNVVDEFKGTTFIKGFSTLLVPTQKVKETILWHLVYNEDGTRISFNDHNLPHVERVSSLELTHSRHVVGWCSEARFFPGSDQCNYTIGTSGLPKPHQGCALANLFVSPGRCIVSNALYSLGKKDTPVHVARNGYIPKLQWLSTKLVLVWDEQDKRGWLINGTSALLYLVRSSLEHNSRDKFRSAFIFKKEDLKESPYPYTADSANDVLINEENCALKLYKENNHFLLLQGRIEHYYNILEKLIDHQSDVSQDSEVNMENLARGVLEGWDFKDLATNRDPLYPRISHLEASGKAWVDFARAAQVITLFGKGFGELIKPTGTGLCQYWSELPKQNYYIAACLSDLDLWVENNDHYNDDQVRLTENIIWHTPSSYLFGSCRCVGSLGPDHCEPVQTLVPVSLSHILLPRKVQIPSQGRGAVIFGQHSTFAWVWGDYGDPEQGKLSSDVSSKRSEAGSSFADSGISLERSKSTLSRESSTPELKRRWADLDYENGSFIANSLTSMSGSHEHGLRDPINYTVGILCALPKESLAVRALFDKCHGKPDLSYGDSNHYSLGQIGKHMVVVACLPEGEYGTNPAAESASNMKRSFPAIQFCLLIGIGGGAPSEQNDIRLGDVVVSKPTKTFPGVIQYDRGKANENSDFQLTGALQRPPRFLMTAVSSLSSDPNLPSDPLEPYLQEIIQRVPDSKKSRYQHPGQKYDELFDEACPKCQVRERCINRKRHLRRRAPRPNNSPEIHYGLIASGNLVIKDAQVRDQWVKKYGVMCFEMEAAGVMNTFPCLVIRGICDYSDSYKNEKWQEYAAATAAAYGKLLLNEVSPSSLSYSPSSELKHRTLEYLYPEESTAKRRRL
ncbi:unnamed protein product [Clonostachys byssicola]|uniref:Nucleoside phosphorylase domain-containing protein n=1 Tax=Clonostachys byssicola TaxID=160290 RepID=A0A9N9XZG5_9HYPO|nr:unnamed protein product [Clonostachys byssicola]